MSALTLDAPADTLAAVAMGDDPAVLGRIGEATVQLAWWRRARPAALDWLDAMDLAAIADLDFAVDVDRLDADVAEGIAEARYPADARGQALAGGISALARRFADVMRCGRVTVRLEVVETDACRRFHADAVTARLLSTLVGPGTQWIAAAAPERIGQMATGDVALFKGRRWAETPAILHRSPPIAGTGDTRLLLAIDAGG